jgi:PAT family beta-lactamase induction signal transducer AmpG
MQFLMLGLAVLTIFAIPQPDAATIAAMGTDVKLFTGVLISFIIMAFASATHDIAADGFYMLALTSGVQAEMIGFRSVFYRLSNVFCNSALIAIPVSSMIGLSNKAKQICHSHGELLWLSQP